MTGQQQLRNAIRKLRPPVPPPEPADGAGPAPCGYGAWVGRKVDYLEQRVAWQRRALIGLALVVALKLLGLQVGIDEIVHVLQSVK